MPDNLTPEQRRKTMQAVKSAKTSLEVTVEQAIRTLGVAYSSNVPDLPGKPDFVFYDFRVCVFVDGDFWHGWQLPRWEEKLSPYWIAKINRNRKRDKATFERLRRAGWIVIRIWEHQIKHDLDSIVLKLKEAVKPRKRGMNRVRNGSTASK